MKRFTFEFDITGRAELVVEAKTLEEAVKKMDGESKLIEWDFDYPDSKYPEDFKPYLASEDDV